jgi:hypothetical protein
VKHIYSITLYILLLANTASAQQLTLRDTLDAALEHQVNLSEINNANSQDITQALGWLDGAPTVSALYLHSQTDMGTNEAELSLSLPIKSQVRKDLERNLKNSSEAIATSAQNQLALYYSGFIRELIWQHESEKAMLNATMRKARLLENLLIQYKQLSELSALPQYALYLLQKEMNDTQILLMQYKRNMANILMQYFTLTGLKYFPESITEALPTTPFDSLSRHPDIQALDATWVAFQQSVSGQTKAAQPWSMQFTARRIEAFEFSENQIGIGVDVPLNVGESLSAEQQSEYGRTKLSYEVERSKRLGILFNTTQVQTSEHTFLLQKQQILDASVDTLDALQASITLMLESNADNQVVHIRNMMELIDAQEQITLNQIAIQQQIANIRQAAGLTL